MGGKQALKNYVSAVTGLRGNKALLERKIGEDLLSQYQGGPERLADLQTLLERHYPAEDAQRLVEEAKAAGMQRDKVTKYQQGQAKQALYDRMKNPETRQAAIDEVSQEYQQYYRMRDKWLDDLEKMVGAMPSYPSERARLRNLPAVAAFPVGAWNQYWDRAGEAKPVSGVEQFFQTNPVGQVMTGLARSAPESLATILNALQTAMPAANAPGVVGIQPGVQLLQYLTAKGILPPPTGTGYETLGGFLAPL
jgi:hypothetical protein